MRHDHDKRRTGQHGAPVGPGPDRALDPIELEVTRSRLEAIAEQAALAVEHTAISPTITESKDYSVTLMDPTGALILGAGMVLFHFGAATHAVKSTIARFGRHHRPRRRLLRQ